MIQLQNSKHSIFTNRANAHYTKYEMPLSHFSGHNFWILKVTNLNRGRGIHVFKDIKSLKKLMEEYCKGVDKASLTAKSKLKSKEKNKETDIEEKKTKSKSIQKYQMNSFIIQKYIEKPFLVYGRKFDIRVWVLVSSAGK
mmetsp:Transcript_28395/g.25122  ORF Transcript_28395/g.25122 Transcript_28395/m.25122 type:complete len:140 (+) Transcript_28395:14-433(+)